MSAQKSVVGIDLGTTHCALAWARSEERAVFAVPQLTAPNAVESQPLLPSFVYFAHATEGALALPWARERSYCVGHYARARAVEAPSRVIASAKSWLSHSGIDRRAGVLPIGAAEDVEKISPVEASWRYLDHLAEAWQHARPSGEPSALSEEEIIITVPASFDAAARDLTVEAAYAAGMENVSLLEEPQAALYAWIESMGDGWQAHLSPGDVVLVIDIGGGTTDFSAIVAVEREGRIELHRVAVGDHILLGGDNMDLALAHAARGKLAETGQALDRWQMNALTHACRSAKEKLLSSTGADVVPVAIAGRGSNLLGSALRTELTRADVEQIIIDGFFPRVGADARPVVRARSALSQLGLPYASDAAVTKHLAAFLGRQARALDGLVEQGLLKQNRGDQRAGKLLHPTKVLFNGGVVKAPAVRARLLDALNEWLDAEGVPRARLLPGEDPDLAVARGAAYYGLVRRGHGLRIRGGTARAYYVGIESPMPAVPGLEPPIVALCVAPFGMEEGTEADLPPQELAVVVGEPVQFRFFGSSVRRADAAGAELEHWAAGELEELSPIEITLPAEGREPGDIVPIHLRASLTAVGTLLIEAVPLRPLVDGESWKVELGVRADAATAEATGAY